ncbi:hypothetical protein GCM10010156_08710 [Planobispora rosea]|uniref:Integral membrane protein n=1 Tax=Planobispora rosea TaxID=35762 RepID=A0A8J3RU25_PLARO|nr:hypothetical protein [Planobispora rosea]GGS52296.1 hypothetical protein GCM10010156_08710 [Planobispora rosea]GIH83036.1 hypothetical protein Pro02_14440 [Planobispora rosea]
MTSSSSPGDELRATVAARRDLGPEFEDSLVESFLEKVDLEIDRRVDQRIEAQSRKLTPAVNPTVAAGQRLALAIVSIVLGVAATIALPLVAMEASYLLLFVWGGIAGVNIAFSRSGRER